LQQAQQFRCDCFGPPAPCKESWIFINFKETTMNATVESKLSEFDFIAVIDASGSMGEEDMPGGKSRWEYMQETATSFVRDLEKFDSDGIDVVLFGGQVTSFQGVTTDKVKDVFGSRSPRGSTPLAEALTTALQLAGKSDKKDFIIVFTDGVPDDKAAAAKVIVDASHSLESDDELTILFVQVGKDAAATAYLTELDNTLAGAKFDIVDAKTMAEAELFPSTTALIEAAIND
jgi:Mg-chelatase subunit ChlD